MNMRTVRDVVGDPQNWSNCVSDEAEPMPHVNGATIRDVFANARGIAVYLRSETGSETLSIFEVADPAVRENLVKALKPGRKIREVLDAPV